MDKKTLYANIIIDISHEKLDRTFQYRIPENLLDQIHPGTPVEIPFGRSNRKIRGYVVEVTEEPEFAPERIKPVSHVIREGIPIEGQLIALAAWMRENFGGTMNQALKTVLPVKQKTTEKEQRLIWLKPDPTTAKSLLGELQRKHQTARARLLEALLEQSPLPYETVTQKLNITASVIRAMQERELIRVESIRSWRNPLDQMKKQGTVVTLNPAQQQIVTGIENGWQSGDERPCLIHGVTGSGKTEVYMELIKSVLREGKQAIVLIPEIALTFQTVLRFYNHFGERVSILNSRMSPGERSDQFERAKRGLLDVMIGPRSALFTPFPNLGVIIIDEEHEAAYKSETVPRYHARETAIARGMLCGAHVVLGSATPSVESYDRAQQGQYRLFEMKERVSARPLPTVYTVDLREELRNGNRSILSDRLRKLMTDRLEKKEQIMLFLNRRGVAGFVSCRSCGEVIKCPHCDVSLNLHNDGNLVCHYCGYQQPMVKKCPSCGSSYVGGFKAGTQKIEQYVRQQFPSARVLRMDLDTTRKKGGYESILSAFSNQEADILIGTQMIVKGHDFPDVTLVGVIAADLSLNAEDYRCGERTFQLLCQAVGRCGRGMKAGEAVIQTYHPEHYSIQASAAQDYQTFYEEEMSYRMLLDYPPASHMLAILGSGENEEVLTQAMHYLELYIHRIYREKDLHVIGPAYAAIGKVKDIYRQVIYLKHKEYKTLVRIKDQMEKYIEINSGFRKIYIQFDFS